MIQRGGDLRLHRLDKATGKEIEPIVRENVALTAHVNTDEGRQYLWMRDNYAHSLVEHALGEYVRGDVYTNSIEGCFSHFKRSIIGVYHKA